jgi:CheY-like chemotaxis protein
MSAKNWMNARIESFYLVLILKDIFMEPKILIIDDSEDNVLLTEMALSKLGRKVRIESALSGEAGLAALRGGSMLPAAVLLDIKMPGMEGHDVLRAIRADEHLCRIPVVVVTNSDLESDEQAAVKEGADGFLHKATNLDQFKNDIENILDCWLNTKMPHR